LLYSERQTHFWYLGGHTKASLKKPYALQLALMGFMVLGWFVLYFAGRMGKTAGQAEMYQLHRFMKKTLEF